MLKEVSLHWRKEEKESLAGQSSPCYQGCNERPSSSAEKKLAVQKGPEWLPSTRKVAGNAFVNGAPKNNLKNGRGAVATCWPWTCLTSLADNQSFASRDAKTGLQWKSKSSQPSECLLPSKIQAIKNNE